MSRTTHSSPAEVASALPRRRVLRAGIAVAAMPWLSPAPASHLSVNAPPLPARVAEAVPELRAQGGGEMSFLGLPIYDGWYWGLGHQWTLTSPFALDLVYHRTLRGPLIAERSVSEMKNLDLCTEFQLSRWSEAIHRIFPDVGSGDRITGLFLPPGTVRFFFNGKQIGEIIDAAFARSFFGIWLDPRTSRADFRLKLLGGP